LRSWAQPLQLPRGKVSYHLLESRNVGAAILDFARSNHVHHIVVGAPMHESHAGKVVAHVTGEAPCGVTVVRAAGGSSDIGKGDWQPPDQAA
jgi:eukaryotic-like serine/threonine-protein kinase